ncbi:MAG: hypothetical protein IPG23_17610 [Burkholderiales bacterium]|nr:hypothetical protein [Burkholderiales bacterium]
MLEAQLTNAKVNSSFDLAIVNVGTSSGTITMAVGTGWTITGLATVTYTTSAMFRARKTGTWRVDPVPSGPDRKVTVRRGYRPFLLTMVIYLTPRSRDQGSNFRG